VISITNDAAKISQDLLREALTPRPLPEALGASTPFHALGLDSLALVGMLVSCEARLGGDVNELERRPPDLRSLRNIGDLQAYVQARLSKTAMAEAQT
jgi:acyl carrier protein